MSAYLEQGFTPLEVSPILVGMSPFNIGGLLTGLAPLLFSLLSKERYGRINK
ncbi:hypothetical protein L6386_05370 [bacterium]|nr:hypothetical protein [bacterium]